MICSSCCDKYRCLSYPSPLYITTHDSVRIAPYVFANTKYSQDPQLYYNPHERCLCTNLPCPSCVIRKHQTITLPSPTSPNLHNVWCCTHRLMVSSPRFVVMSEISSVIRRSELCWGIRRGPMILSSVLWDIHPQLHHHDNNSDIVCLVALSYTR